jgi:hypothetical protein
LKARPFSYSGCVQVFLLSLMVFYVWFLPEHSLSGIQLDVLGDVVGVGGFILVALQCIWRSEFRHSPSKKNSRSRIPKLRMNSLAEIAKPSRTIVDLYHELPLVEID